MVGHRIVMPAQEHVYGADPDPPSPHTLQHSHHRSRLGKTDITFRISVKADYVMLSTSIRSNHSHDFLHIYGSITSHIMDRLRNVYINTPIPTLMSHPNHIRFNTSENQGHGNDMFDNDGIEDWCKNACIQVCQNIMLFQDYTQDEDGDLTWTQTNPGIKIMNVTLVTAVTPIEDMFMPFIPLPE